MLRALAAATAARRSRGFSLLSRNVNSRALSVCSPSQSPLLAFRVRLRNFSSSENDASQTNISEFSVETHQLSDSQAPCSVKHSDLSDDTESLYSADEDNFLADSPTEGDVAAEDGKDSSPNPNSESDQDCTIDMSNVPEDLKEMLEDDYEIESAGEDLPFEEPVELLTIDEVKQVLEEVRARDVQIFSVQDRCEWTDVMVAATGISDRHVRGIADALVFKIKKKGNIEPSLYPTIEGQVGGKWLVVDCGNIVIHVLNEDSRAYYRLEDLWTGDTKPSTTDEDLEKMLQQAGLKDVVP